ncbi:unnamed protein product, partial [Mesorhabditis belari]|uniref:Uncharacterized protein n=1 Tax=Mesorhabditis belari TaxID=2138241 RepID=A0AAF3EXR4_9BILA
MRDLEILPKGFRYNGHQHLDKGDDGRYQQLNKGEDVEMLNAVTSDINTSTVEQQTIEEIVRSAIQTAFPEPVDLKSETIEERIAPRKGDEDDSGTQSRTGARKSGQTEKKFENSKQKWTLEPEIAGHHRFNDRYDIEKLKSALYYLIYFVDCKL